MLRLVSLICAVALIANFVGFLTGAIPERARFLLLAIGGLGLAVVTWVERRRRAT